MIPTSYYESVAKPAREAALRRAAQLGAPEGACFLPDGTTCYNFDATEERVWLNRWTPAGKHIRTSEPVINGAVTYRGVRYVLHKPSLSLLLPDGEPVAENLWVNHRARALIWADCKDVNPSAIGNRRDVTEASRRSYHRRQARLLLANMPEGYRLLPGTKTTAYRLTGGCLILARVASPQTAKATGTLFIKDTYDFKDEFFYKGHTYRRDAASNKLYRDGYYDVDLYGAPVIADESWLAFEDNCPANEYRVPNKKAWYRILLGDKLAIEFHQYHPDGEVVTTVQVKRNRVQFDGDTFLVDSYGKLTML